MTLAPPPFGPTSSDPTPAIDGMPGVPSRESDYLDGLRDRLSEVLGERLAGVYAGGSYALGDYLPGRSDLDVAAVVRSPLSPEFADAIVSQLHHDALPCPARCLELVVYMEETARSGSPARDFALNLNTGVPSRSRCSGEATPAIAAAT